MSDSRATIVLGMHRSGTSAIAGLLSETGVTMGRRLFNAQRGVNDKGFFENAAVVKLNERFLDRANHAWDQPTMLQEEDLRCSLQSETACTDLLTGEYAGIAHWGIKDPRMCLTLPLWREAISKLADDVQYLLCLRNPAEVAASICKRDGFSRDKAAYLWMNYTLSAWHYTRHSSRLLVRYEDVLADPKAVAARVHRTDASSAQFENLKFIDQSLHRNRESTWNESPVQQLASRAYDALLLEQTEGGSSIDACVDEYRALDAALSAVLKEHLAQVQQSETHYRTLFERAYYSWWWKLALPLKKLEEAFRKQP
ncbi:MAG: sulfotransferase [Pseudomonadota bacterium]